MGSAASRRAGQRGRMGTSAALVAWMALGTGCAGPAGPAEPRAIEIPPPAPAEYLRLAAQTDALLRDGVLGCWFPRCVDPQRGGFHQRFAEDWTPIPDENKFLVFQARMTWVAAKASAYDPALREGYRRYALHGLDYLAGRMWDRQFGGLHYRLDPNGAVSLRLGDEKHAYGISFGVYAAAAVYAATREKRALDLAVETFGWLDEHAHDGKNGGYFEALARDGGPIQAPYGDDPSRGRRDGLGTPYGYKSMNTHIHLLEAFTELYRVRPDALLRQRLEEMLAIVRGRVAVEPGCLNYYFTFDWRAVPMHDSFGHDVETAYLLVEAADALGRADDPETWKVARSLVDHALDWGWDDEHGGFYEKGEAFAAAHDRKKVWWTQVEGLNALLLMHERFGGRTDRYWRAFIRQKHFIWTHQVDPLRGGLYAELSREGTPLGDRNKGSDWKAAYHDGRALMNVASRLRELAKREGPSP